MPDWTTREELNRLYWEERISIPKIAVQYGQAYDTVLHWFQIWNIPRRGKGAFNRKYFDEDECQEAKRASWRKYRHKPGIQHEVYDKAARKWQKGNWQRYLGYCQISSKRRHTKVALFLQRVKRKFGCSRCGYRKCTAALDFHHRDPKTKIFAIGRRLSESIKKLKDEIRKCDIICANCHRAEHYQGKKRITLASRFAVWCGCQVCGYKKCSAALEYHHPNINKKFNVKGKKRSRAEMKAEIRKCTILCANCHKEVHWQSKIPS